ncbi:MAG: hypothetical protein QM773_19925 [Hyphomonadaceae bacterium]
MMKLPIIEGPPEENDPRPPLASRLVWFVALWVAGAAAVAAVAYALRALIL